MLRQLVINNLAVIDSLDLEFKPGMTVLTGETGAGKSILLDALGLILGDRADANIIRGDNDKTDVTAVFSIENNLKVINLLREMDIETGNELFVRRIVSRDNRSKAYLNDTLVSVQSLRNIGECLVDIHGQHAHQSLSRTTVQRELLDQFGEYDSLLSSINETYRDLKLVTQQLRRFESGSEDFEARSSLLHYQIAELTHLNIGKSEYAELSEKYKRVSNSKRLLESCQTILNDLAETHDSISDKLAKHQRNITDLSTLDPALDNIGKLLGDAHIQIEEARVELRDYLEQIDSDPEQLTQIENRLDKLHELARKHKIKPEMLSEQLEFLTTQLNQLEGGQEQYTLLQKKKEKLYKNYFSLAKQLTNERISTAEKISEAVTEKIHELGMGGTFKVDTETLEERTPHQFGMDKITFMVSTNLGQPFKAMTRIASGGELSRLGLAIQIIGLKENGVATLIFDEVDAGIGGGIAEIVGKLLFSLTEHHQILCVTHLPQVASCGHHHLRVRKKTVGNKTFTYVHDLNEKERIEEIARMLAGVTITEESRANAKKMLRIQYGDIADKRDRT